MLRVLVVDDSWLFVQGLSQLIAEDPEMCVVGTASHGGEAIALARQLKPDLIVMDVHMPGINGLDAAAAIVAQMPVPIVLVTGAGQQMHALDMLRFGAVDVLQKDLPLPAAPAQAAKVRRRLKVAASVAVARFSPLWRAVRVQPTLAQPRLAPARPPGVVAAAGGAAVVAAGVVASTGGPQALAEILENLPVVASLAVLVVQHLPAGFAPSFVTWLQRVTPWRVALAQHGAVLEGGVVLVAPDGAHLAVDAGGAVRLEAPVENDAHCPSGDHLLASLAASYGRGAVGVVLSGMGRDGAAGLGALRRAGGAVLVQQPESCVVASMPQACLDSGAAAWSAPLDALSAALEQAVDKIMRSGAHA